MQQERKVGRALGRQALVLEPHVLVQRVGCGSVWFNCAIDVEFVALAFNKGALTLILPTRLRHRAGLQQRECSAGLP